MIGELLDHYRVLELIGRGAMGVVYKGLDVNLDRQVAIKVMSVEARNDPDFVERFRQEARMQGALNHPNIAVLFDYFIHDGVPVVVMEYIDGESFEYLIRKRGPIPAAESIPIFKQALRGVAAAHRAGIIHRDLKPSNLMLTRDDLVKVMDFGIAKRQGSSSATKASTSIGSPLYMAPEQILGRAVDCRTDIYALGITLYQLLSGQPPFNPRGKAEFVLLNSHVNDLPEPPSVYCRDIPPPLVDAVMRALAKDPDARFQSADEFMQALPDTPAPAPRAPPPRPGTGTILLSRVGSGTIPLPRVNPSTTVALEYAPPMSGDSLDFALPPEEPESAPGAPAAPAPPPAAPTARGTMMFDYSARTLLKETSPRASSAPSSAAPPPAARPRLLEGLRAHRLSAAALLIATVALGALLRHPERLTAVIPSASPPAEAPASAPAPAAPEPAAPPTATAASPDPEPASAEDVVTASPAPAADTPPVVRTVPVRADLEGRWSGAYFDASGRQRLRVVSLSISRVQADGGIEGTLEYQAASGNGECKLHPRGSSYSAGAQRLQLSPEACTAHYPRELGVPLDFDGVNPQANTLRNGRIEAPTGELIRVRLQRVSGA